MAGPLDGLKKAGKNLDPETAELSRAATTRHSGKLEKDYIVDISGKKTVLYMSGNESPFRCGHCEYYVTPRACRLVAGDIDPDGCCSLYEKAPEGQDQKD